MRRIFFALCLGLAALTARAAHTQVQLLVSADTAPPGATIWAGVDLKMDPGWHTYWKNPGDAGIATEIKWQLPPGVRAGDIQWPLPEKLPPAEVTTYGYENEVMLLVPLTLASNLPAGPLKLSAKISWLECMQSCVPGSTNVEATVMVGDEAKKSAATSAFESWEKRVPQTNAFYQFQAGWETATNDVRPLVISSSRGGADKNVKLDSVDFFPDAGENFEIQPAVEILSAYSSEIKLRLFVKKFSGDWPRAISGVLALNSREGLADSLTTKFNNLYIFYKNVIPRVGWDTYKIINLKYANQVVGVKSDNRKSDTSKVKLAVADSIKLNSKKALIKK